jgi:hypothetical protein
MDNSPPLELQVIQRQHQRIKLLEAHVTQLKEWFEGMGQEVIERPDGKLQLRVKER